jgi:GGDEF domain-containing protein
MVLTRIAQLLEQNCRRSDVVARYGRRRIRDPDA